MKLVVAAGVVAAGGGGAWYVMNADPPVETTAGVDLARAETMSFDIETTASGELKAATQVELRSKLEQTAAVVSVVPEGTWVEEGEVLCVLNTESLETKLDEEQAFLEEEKAELVAAQNSLEIQKSDNDSAYRDADLKLRLAELSLNQWEQGDSIKSEETFKLALDKAQRELGRLAEQFERSKELVEEGFISQNQYNLDELALVEAEANLTTATLDLEIYQQYQWKQDKEQKEADVEQAQAELDRVLKQNEIKLADKLSVVLREERSNLRVSNRIKDLETQIAAATIAAPSAGLVVYGTTVEAENRRWSNEGPLQIGKDVRPNELVIALPDTSNMVASIRVHESLAGRVRPGQRANVKIDALGGKVIPASVESIGVLAESGGWRDPNLREYSVRLTLEPGELASELKPSMRCEAIIQLGRAEDVLAVPVQALFSEGQLRYVHIPEGRGVRRVPIRAGRVSELYAEIAAGLEPGDPVLVREPTAGGIIDTSWDTDDLAAVGFTLNDEGAPVPAGEDAVGGKGSGGGSDGYGSKGPPGQS
ncbi:MAG: hypothetical protein AAF108_01955 [Planctomycetota bacterium]